MIIKEINELDALTKFIKSQPHAEILQSPLWAQVQEAAGRPVFYVGMFEEDKPFHPHATCLLIRHLLPFGKSWLYSPRLNWPADSFLTLVNVVTAIAKKEKAIFWKLEMRALDNIPISNSPSLRQRRTFLISNPLQYPETFVIDLAQTENQLLRQMKSKTRYNIGLARKKGVNVRWSTDITDVKIFYGLLTQTARRQKIKIHPKTHYKNILKILGKQDVAALIIAEFSGKAIAANLITFFGDTAVYLHGGTNDKYHSMMSPHLLQWETILEASRRGCRYYDLGGCAVKIGKIDQWIGMTRFKAGFGGKLFQFGDTYDLVFNKKWYWLYQLKNRL